MKKYVLFIMTILISMFSINTSYAVFPETVSQKRQTATGYDGFTVYDGVNNSRFVPLDNTPPTISTPTYSGDNYIINITTNKSDSTQGLAYIKPVYLWKVIDDNDTIEYDSSEQITSTTITRPMEGVTFITVYDHANNSTTIHLEKTPPSVSSPTYLQGNYIVTVSDPGDDNGTGSGIWKITDGNASDYPISKGQIIRPKTVNGAETIYVYDKANNVTSVGLTASKPKIISLDKKASETSFTLKAKDASVDLWKVTESIGGTGLTKVTGTFSGKNCDAKYNLSSNNVRTIYVYNHAGNYTTVDLEEYETSNFAHTYTCRVTGGDYDSITVYDAVGNPATRAIDNTEPTISEPYFCS